MVRTETKDISLKDMTAVVLMNQMMSTSHITSNPFSLQDCQKVCTKDYVTARKGLFGIIKKENPLLAAAQQTDFPSWNAMVGTSGHLKNSMEIFRKRTKLNQLENVKHHDLESPIKSSIQKHHDFESPIKIIIQKEFLNSNTVNDELKDNGSKRRSKINSNMHRRCSDTAMLQKMDFGVCNTFHQKKATKETCPSHYKGKRRGTYAAVYDPQLTIRKPRSETRSRSLFIKAEDIQNEELRIRLRQSMHHSIQLDDDANKDIARNSKYPIMNKTSQCKQEMMNRSKSYTHIADDTCDDDDKSLHKTRIRLLTSLLPDFMQRNHSMTDLHRVNSASPNINRRSHFINKQARTAIDRTYRALSSFDGVSEEHLKQLEKKYEKAQKRAQSICSKNSSCCEEWSSDDSTKSEENSSSHIHETVKSGDVEELKYLINNGHDVNSLDKLGHPPCHYALVNGHFDCLAILMTSGANLRDYFGKRRVKYFR